MHSVNSVYTMYRYILVLPHHLLTHAFLRLLHGNIRSLGDLENGNYLHYIYYMHIYIYIYIYIYSLLYTAIFIAIIHIIHYCHIAGWLKKTWNQLVLGLCMSLTTGGPFTLSSPFKAFE